MAIQLDCFASLAMTSENNEGPGAIRGLFGVGKTHANAAEHLPEEGAVPVSPGRAPHRRALRRPVKSPTAATAAACST